MQGRAKIRKFRESRSSRQLYKIGLVFRKDKRFFIGITVLILSFFIIYASFVVLSPSSITQKNPTTVKISLGKNSNGHFTFPLHIAAGSYYNLSYNIPSGSYAIVSTTTQDYSVLGGAPTIKNSPENLTGRGIMPFHDQGSQSEVVTYLVSVSSTVVPGTSYFNFTATSYYQLDTNFKLFIPGTILLLGALGFAGVLITDVTKHKERYWHRLEQMDFGRERNITLVATNKGESTEPKRNYSAGYLFVTGIIAFAIGVDLAQSSILVSFILVGIGTALLVSTGMVLFATIVLRE